MVLLRVCFVHSKYMTDALISMERNLLHQKTYMKTAKGWYTYDVHVEGGCESKAKMRYYRT